ncbi:hypothetical protein EDD37DRAFT_650661 [Exophiala viscosa]|uniref:uncharacterized protein n=1 Tax=Exophiala viscosa TaxID=2486360 RepID=UPI0021937050|nr:hypothetical protein EDD37DRAFT_650661 [Exophiala viscosa]
MATSARQGMCQVCLCRVLKRSVPHEAPEPDLDPEYRYGGRAASNLVDAYSCCGVGPCNIFCCNCDNGCIAWDHCPDNSGKRDVTWPDWSGAPSGNNLAEGGSASANATCSPTASTEDCVLAKFDILDIGDDGKVSILELLAGWALVWIVSDESDTSTDPADYIYLVKKFEKFDTNGDGYLTLEECAQQLS